MGCGPFSSKDEKEQKVVKNDIPEDTLPRKKLSEGVDIHYKQPVPPKLWLVHKRKGTWAVLEKCTGRMPGITVDMGESIILRYGSNWTERYKILSTDARKDTATKIVDVEMTVLDGRDRERTLNFSHNAITNFIVIHGFPKSRDEKKKDQDTLFVDVQFWDHIAYYKESCR